MKALLTITLSIFLISCSTGPVYERTVPLEPTVIFTTSEGLIEVNTNSAYVYYPDNLWLGFSTEWPVNGRPEWTFFTRVYGRDILQDIGERSWIHDVQSIILPGVYHQDSLNYDDEIKANSDSWFRHEIRNYRTRNSKSETIEWVGKEGSTSKLVIDSVYRIEEYYYLAGKLEGTVRLRFYPSVNEEIKFEAEFYDLYIIDFKNTN